MLSRYFLGANTARGFSSLYDRFPDAEDFLTVVKGGPGCGKSTLMRRIGEAAERAGTPVEYIHCSGDPESLDAVRLPELNRAWVDGTAPHVIEAQLPGAASRYLDMSRFLNVSALVPLRGELEDVTRRYRALYDLAYRQLAASAALHPRSDPTLRSDPAVAQAARRAERFAARALPCLGKAARVEHRFLSAVSCRGYLTLTDTLAPYERRLLADNALGFGWAYLDALAACAVKRGYDVVLCHDPLESERLEAVLLPELSLAAVTADRSLRDAPITGRRLRLDGLIGRDRLRDARPLLRQRTKESALLLRAAKDTLARAKALHDELEALYRGCVDFGGADELAKEQIRFALS